MQGVSHICGQPSSGSNCATLFNQPIPFELRGIRMLRNPCFLNTQDIKIALVHYQEELKVSQAAHIHAPNGNALLLPPLCNFGLGIWLASRSICAFDWFSMVCKFTFFGVACHLSIFPNILADWYATDCTFVPALGIVHIG